eukprot:4936064-Prymnesium_polylepis.1
MSALPAAPPSQRRTSRPRATNLAARADDRSMPRASQANASSTHTRVHKACGSVEPSDAQTSGSTAAAMMVPRLSRSRVPA